MQGSSWISGFLLCVVFSAWAAAAAPPSPPEQPARGPGGAQVLRISVTKTRVGDGARGYWLFKPESPSPTVFPLIVFLHGWGATNPAIYGAWIDHLVKRGNIVVYPRYQTDLRTPTADFLRNTVGALQDAIRLLEKAPAHVRPDLGKLAVVGHSVGGLLAANVAAVAARSGIPRIGAVLAVQPGRTWNRQRFASVGLEDLGRIPSGTLMLVVVGDQDQLARDIDGKRIYYESKRVSARDKNFVRLRSDHHGQPALLANHLVPVAPDPSYDDREEITAGEGALRAQTRATIQRQIQGEESLGEDKETIPLVRLTLADALRTGVDALDYYGLWKLFDALCDAAFYGRNRKFALGNTLQQRFMGHWSDGKPVQQLFVTDNP